MSSSHHVSPESAIDVSRLSSLQIVIMVLCAAIAMIDGFDTQSIAFVAPHIADAWNIPASSFGPVFGAGLLGSFVGALTLGPLGDRIGRKPGLFISVLIFAVGTLLTPLAGSIHSLVAMRFGTGLGLGGALPCFISLASEYAPKRSRESLVSLMFCGFPVGAVIGGLLCGKLVAQWGWKSAFIAGGALPILIMPVFMAVVPESIEYLARRGKHAKVQRILTRLGNDRDWDVDLTALSPPERISIAGLFADRRALGTLLLWATLFLSLLLTYFLINWIPLVARSTGADVGLAVIAVSMLNLGAVFGCVGIGRLADRFAPPIVIGCAYGGGAVAIFLMGQVQGSGTLLCVTAFVAGMLSIGAQMCTVSFCASFYGTHLRATGVGWAMGIGRVGAICGPVLGGLLLDAGMGTAALFSTTAVASLGAAAAMWLMKFSSPH
ncbi:MFS transporter [Paraburkholderia phenazinium]|uniref:MFS transporter, AAHS family, 4-hydroxybenzoate transporter n=1 Tax=Paraburkholderia phenazinium TaxID=60549 RepID=A0A1N6G6D9_9BURK|nr:MFS transporter [Paraburkholderia phenazinium]SIO03090.1 MFS transporter, AAHS family, 4-hydroxybenzoate transporter [Paraburkholderia phenazinium]